MTKVISQGVSKKLVEYTKDEFDDLLIDDSFEVKGGIKSYFKPLLDTFKNTLDTSKLNIGFITDAHYEELPTGYQNSPLSLSHFANITEVSDSLDLLIAGGDNVNSEENSFKCRKRAKDVADLLFTRSKCDVIIAKGNHDDGSNKGFKGDYSVITDDEFKTYYRTAKKLARENRNNDSLYCYRDFSEHMVRVIVLDTNDVPYILDNGVPRYKKLNTFGVRNEQLNWLANALKLPSKLWHVVVFAHAPLTGTHGMSETFYNSDVITNILQAFKNGTSYTFTRNSDVDFPVDVNTSFVGQGAGTIIAYINGHQHYDKLQVYNGITSVETHCSVCNTEVLPARIVGTSTEDCWDVFEIDSQNRKVNIKRFGYGNNRSFTY